MTFARLSQYFEKLDNTSSRLSLIDILCDLFKEAKPQEVAEISYLLQGRVSPFYQATEIGMAEKGIAAAISRAYGVDRDEVLKLYGKLGDLGKVALRLSFDRLRIAQGKLLKKHSLTVNEVFETLRGIARTTGEGTVEKKISSLAGLLVRVDGVGAKHLVRIPLGTSRLGIGDPTILDAWAKLKLGDRSKRKLLESAYNKVSDLGLIGQTLWRRGVKGVGGLAVRVGIPIRSQLAERLPDAKSILEKFYGKAHTQEKWDGFRIQIHKNGNQIRLFSRNLEETTHMFPEIIEATLKQVKAKTAILDSEALAYNPSSDEFLPFQETTKRRRKYDIEEMQKKLPLKAFVFDVMFLNGKSLMDQPLTNRVKHIEGIIEGEDVLIPKPGEIVSTVERMEELFNDAMTKGLEGLVVKRVDSLYEAGARNFNWVKLKRHASGELRDTIDCVILGYIFGRGKRATFGAGALLVGVYDESKDAFLTVSKIGTGLTDEEWRQIHKRADKIKLDKKATRVNSLITPSVWIKPEIVIEVLADEITRSPIHTAGYALRFPRLVRFRENDKKAEDATTLDELVKMYKSQFKR